VIITECVENDHMAVLLVHYSVLFDFGLSCGAECPLPILKANLRARQQGQLLNQDVSHIEAPKGRFVLVFCIRFILNSRSDFNRIHKPFFFCKATFFFLSLHIFKNHVTSTAHLQLET